MQGNYKHVTEKYSYNVTAPLSNTQSNVLPSCIFPLTLLVLCHNNQFDEHVYDGNEFSSLCTPVYKQNPPDCESLGIVRQHNSKSLFLAYKYVYFVNANYSDNGLFVANCIFQTSMHIGHPCLINKKLITWKQK
ncbi:hypothetical protein CEXT_396551 [Caerostris extrusa]|uniref:ZP domain-containing protein n=1 Tax=Caerostris extrusa TaxID=172846 RepID=A0AAV4YDN4_CAEEX|nr:hypothetical protein CEXT_396551 [Caerostris extrusa]